MDQLLVAGLGNMLSDEVLWRARLHPTRVASTLAPAEGKRLCAAAGSPWPRRFVPGSIPRTRSWLPVKRAIDDPTCPRCGSNLRWSTVNGRSALWCPRCQLPPRQR